jgi:hypothetical protein
MAILMESTGSLTSNTTTTISVTQGDNIDLVVTKPIGNIGNSPDGITVTVQYAQ